LLSYCPTSILAFQKDYEDLKRVSDAAIEEKRILNIQVTSMQQILNVSSNLITKTPDVIKTMQIASCPKTIMLIDFISIIIDSIANRLVLLYSFNSFCPRVNTIDI